MLATETRETSVTTWSGRTESGREYHGATLEYLDGRIWDGMGDFLTPPERLLPSQWAERYRELRRGETSRPGKWSNAVVPVWACVINLPFVCPTVRKMNVIKAGQVGGSEAMRSMVGSIAEQEPDPVLLNLPDKENGKRIFADRILKLFTGTQRLRALLTDEARDRKLTQITLKNGFSMRLSWSGSPSSMASDPIRFAFNDEVDKYQRDPKEADPIRLVETRMTSYENSLLVNWSTPTVADGLIHRLYENSPIKLHFHAPCPHCGRFQTLRWNQLKWEQLDEKLGRVIRSALIESKKLAWYECEGCQGKVTECERSATLNAGYLGTEDGGFKLWVDGRHEGRLPEGTEVGIKVHALHSLMPKHRLHTLAAQIVEAGSDAGKVHHVRNNVQAEPFEQQLTVKKVDVFSAKCRPDEARKFVPGKAKVVPRWATKLIMTVDTQKDHFWFVVRAWGHRFRSQRVHHGRARTFDDLRQLAFASYFPYEDPLLPPLCCAMLGIDAMGGVRTESNGSRTQDVYDFAKTDPRIYALRGEQERGGRTIWASTLSTQVPPLTLWHVERQHFQDVLDGFISGRVRLINGLTGEELEEVEQFALNDDDDPEYNRQLASTAKVKEGHRRQMVERWKTITEGADDHLRDCEVYNVGLAHGPGEVALIPPPELVEQQRAVERQARLAMPEEPAPGWVNSWKGRY